MIKRMRVTALLLCTSSLALIAAPEPLTSSLPGITRSAGTVYLIENHSTDLNIWHSRHIRGATLIHLDAHDDCRYVSPAKLATIQQLLAANNYAEIFRQSDIESSFRYKIQPDNFLFDLGNFIYPCIMDGTVSRFYWVIPDKTLDKESKARLQTHIQLALKLPSLDGYENGENSFSFSLSNCVITITTLDSLPKIEEPALLDIDTDFFVFPVALTESHITGDLIWNPASVCTLLSDRVPKPSLVTVCSSISGGYLPVTFRFISDGCFNYFAFDKTYPEDAQHLLAAVHTLRAQEPTTLREPADPLFRAAYEHLKGLYLIVDSHDTDAMECIDRASHLQPAYAKSMLDLSQIFIGIGKISLARNMIDRYDKFMGCETSPSTAMKVRVYLAEHALDKASILSRQLVDWDRTPYFLMFQGGILVEQGKIADALDIYREIMRTHPDNAFVFYNMGMALSKQGNTNDAIENYQAALKLKPDMATAQENLGHIYLHGGRNVEAVDHLKAAVSLDPFNIISLNNLGLALIRQERFLEAIDCYHMALRLNPMRAELHANLALALLKADRLDEGMEHCKKALELKPDWPEVRKLLEEGKARRRQQPK